MAKAKLVTRTATSSTVTDDNLNKASALTHAEMDSNLINLRDSSFGIADDTSTVLQVTHDKTITIAGGTNTTTALSGDTLTINSTGDVTGSSTTTFTNKTFDANGTGNSISNIETADIAAGTLVTASEGIGSNNNDTTIPTSAAVKAYADSVGGGGSATGLTFVGDDSSGTLISDGETVKIAGGTNITTAMSGDTLTVTGPDLSSYATGSSTTTFTNKTIDANGTGNNISNIDIGNMTAAVIVTESEGIGSNDNDTTIPTSAAVKAYADSVGGGGGGGGTITALNNQAENRLVSIGSTTTQLDGEANLTFDGSTLTLTGSAALDGVTITDNLISTNRSNDTLGIGSNGTGQINLSTSGNFSTADMTESAASVYGSAVNTMKGVGLLYKKDGIAEITATADRQYVHSILSEWKLNTGINSSNSNMRFRNYLGGAMLDMNGSSSTQTSFSRGIRAVDALSSVVNSDSTASTLGSGVAGNMHFTLDLENSSGDVTVTNAAALNLASEVTTTSGRTGTITNSYGANYEGGIFGGGTGTITNEYGFYVNGMVGTNKYAFYDASNSLSVFGDIQTQAVSITDNLITTNRSNDNLELDGNGTGQVHVGDALNDAFTGSFGNILNFNGHRFFTDYGTVAHQNMTSGADRQRGHVLASTYQLTEGQSSSDSDNRYRNATMGATLDVNGGTSNPTSVFSGVQGGQSQTAIIQSSNTASELGQATGLQIGNYLYVPGGNGAVTVNRAYANLAYNEIDTGSNSSAAGTITEAIGYRYHSDNYGSGTETMTNDYAFYYKSSGATNSYAFYSEVPTATSRMGAINLDNQGSNPSNRADSAWIYAKDHTDSKSHVYAQDEDGNDTKLSPHNDAGEWEFYSHNKTTGKTVRVNMERMIKKLEQLTGETFIESE